MNEKSVSMETMRLDKWLWCARFFKTRAQAAEAIKGGKIRFNDTLPKPARTLQVGDRLLIRKVPYQFDITVLRLCNHRCSASDAALLYTESRESVEARALLTPQLKAEAAMYPRTRGRPTKRDRREIIRFTQGSNSGD